MTRIVLAVVCLAACGSQEAAELPPCTSIAAGALIITEVLANPDGDDDGLEWLEIYNASDAAIDLSRLSVVAAESDGLDEQTHRIEGLAIEPGEYRVLGGVLPELAPAHVDYGYGSDLGSLNNRDGKLLLRCGEVEVDAVVYADMADGIAQGLDGAIAPNASANDDRANWCPATASYDATGNLGSPGTANPACVGGVPTECTDDGIARALISPTVGDLVITELMANPEASSDDSGEWFEVFVARDVDLNGLVAGRAEVDAGWNAMECLRVSAGTHLVFARSMTPSDNGELPSPDFLFDFGLTNSSGRLFIGLGDLVLDEVSWPSVPSGASRSLDPEAMTPSANDDQARWCPGQAAYGAGDLGTPGAANPPCPAQIGDDECFDDGLGATRAIIAPRAGELVVNELMADPAGSGADGVAEWVELRAVAGTFDLNGIELRRDLDVACDGSALCQQLVSTRCLSLSAEGPSALALLVRSADATVNGMLTELDALLELTLPNGGGAVSIAIAGVVLDTLTYPAAGAALADGVAVGRDPQDLEQTCNSPTTRSYGTTGTTPTPNFGTPGAPNDACLP